METETHQTSNQKPDCRWKTYGAYKCIMWAWMMNEITVVLTPVQISHSGFYLGSLMYLLATIIIGIPLVYSEICLAQYTNNNVISMWNHFPILRGVGYGSLFLVTLKAVYLLVLNTWYLVYTVYSVTSSPPWSTCENFNDTNCMVKRINVSVFQHCIETQVLFDEDCGMKTASCCFFEREIGDNNTDIWPRCLIRLKLTIASASICIGIYIFSLRNYMDLQILVKYLAGYIGIVTFVLLSVVMSTNGTWYAKKVMTNWNGYSFNHLISKLFKSVTDGFLSLGTGFGVIGSLSRDVPFRSPATMTSIATSLLSVLIALLLALIAFAGLKTMSYYHGEEENVIEIHDNMFFTGFASISELISYFDGSLIWSFAWFSAVFCCLFVNLSILFIHLKELRLCNFLSEDRNNNWYGILIISLLYIFTLPFFCSDLTPSLSKATEVIQILSSLFFSLALYWIYGFKKHNIDITFMIGIKASYFRTFTCLINPIMLGVILYFKLADSIIGSNTGGNCYIGKISCDILIFYILVSIYLFIVIVYALTNVIIYGRHKIVCSLFVPAENWGPRDFIMFKSRNMFAPEIMTREFLYRQVKIGNYSRTNKLIGTLEKERKSSFSFEE